MKQPENHTSRISYKSLDSFDEVRNLIGAKKTKEQTQNQNPNDHQKPHSNFQPKRKNPSNKFLENSQEEHLKQKGIQDNQNNSSPNQNLNNTFVNNFSFTFKINDQINEMTQQQMEKQQNLYQREKEGELKSQKQKSCTSNNFSQGQMKPHNVYLDLEERNQEIERLKKLLNQKEAIINDFKQREKERKSISNYNFNINNSLFQTECDSELSYKQSSLIQDKGNSSNLGLKLRKFKSASRIFDSCQSQNQLFQSQNQETKNVTDKKRLLGSSERSSELIEPFRAINVEEKLKLLCQLLNFNDSEDALVQAKQLRKETISFRKFKDNLEIMVKECMPQKDKHLTLKMIWKWLKNLIQEFAKLKIDSKKNYGCQVEKNKSSQVKTHSEINYSGKQTQNIRESQDQQFRKIFEDKIGILFDIVDENKSKNLSLQEKSQFVEQSLRDYVKMSDLYKRISKLFYLGEISNQSIMLKMLENKISNLQKNQFSQQ